MRRRNYYIIRDKFTSDPDYAYGQTYANTILGDCIECDKCGRVLTLRQWLGPYTIYASKKKLGDIIFGVVDEFIVSDKFFNILMSNAPQGITSHESVSVNFRGKLIATYKLARLKILPGNIININKSDLKLLGAKKCSDCQLTDFRIRRIGKLVFEDQNINEVDIFRPQLFPSLEIVTEKMRDILVDAGITNVHYINALDHLFDDPSAE